MSRRSTAATRRLLGLATLGFAGASLANGLWVPLPSVLPAPSPLIPAPHEVSGKEYSTHVDYDFTYTPKPEQTLAWDGIGGVRDGLFYGPRIPGGPAAQPGQQVDGMAFEFDALYGSVIVDASALVFSVGGVGYGLPASPLDAHIFAEPVAAAGGAGAAFTWAAPATIDRVIPPSEVDALELWGPQTPDDGICYSLYGDPLWIPPVGGGGKVAIWKSGGGGGDTPHTFTFDLATAIDMQFGFGGAGPMFSHLVEFMDLDAMMVQGQEVLFSIAPITFPTPIPTPGGPLFGFDGGEIFEYTPGLPTSFLFHGGHLWDTAFDVMGTFHLPTENIDGIEAVSFVPEPAAASMLLLAAMPVLRRRRV